MKHLLPIVLLAVAPLTARAAAQATDTPASETHPLLDDAEVALNFGTFGALDTERLFEIGLEYRLGGAELADGTRLRPMLGTSVLADGGNYTYAGGRMELGLGGDQDWELGLSSAPGVYSSGGFDLGGPLEFRSGIDLGAAVAEDIRASFGLYHLSNGGLYSINRGAESVLLSLSVGL